MNCKNIVALITAPITLLAAGHFVTDVYSGFIFPILPFIANKLNISLPMAGLIIAISGLSSSVLQPIYGYLSDKISHRFFVIWGLIIASIFVSLTGIANTYFLLAVCVLIGNMGVGLYHPQATAYVGKFKKKEMNINLSMGIFVGGGIIGYAFGPMLSSLIVYFLGLEWTPIAAIPGIIVTCFIYMFLPRIQIEQQHISLRAVFNTFMHKKNILIPLIVIVIIRSFILLAMSTYLPFEWEDNLGYSVLTVGLVMAVFSLVAGICSVLGGSLASKFGEQQVLLGSFLIPLPILLLAIYFMKTFGIISFALYIIGGAILESTISVSIVMTQRIIPQYLGIVSGITGGFCWGIAGLLMYPVGIIIKLSSIYSVLTYVTLLVIIAVIIIYCIPKDVFIAKEA